MRAAEALPCRTRRQCKEVGDRASGSLQATGPLLKLYILRPSEPNDPNNHLPPPRHNARPQRVRPRGLSWSPSHSSAAHHASLCMARLRAAAASEELTPPKAEASAPRCGGVELPSQTVQLDHAPCALANCTSPTTARSRRACAPRELSAARRARMWRNGPWVDPIGVQVASPRPNTRGGARR